jgi:hypothetical protein
VYARKHSVASNTQNTSVNRDEKKIKQSKKTTGAINHGRKDPAA